SVQGSWCERASQVSHLPSRLTRIPDLRCIYSDKITSSLMHLSDNDRIIYQHMFEPNALFSVVLPSQTVHQICFLAIVSPFQHITSVFTLYHILVECTALP
ncbi:hypothetical protein M758_UG243400, partial [Ceratodon purpureus]